MEAFSSNSETFWTKEKIKEVITRYASEAQPRGAGDQPWRCRLCAGTRGLRALSSPRGEHYDSLIRRCFGIMVTPPDAASDSMICECCVRQLHSTERFRALVEAAFDKTLSGSATASSSATCVPLIEPQTLTIKPPIEIKSVSREIIPSASRVVIKKKANKEKKIQNSTPVSKKNNIACSICKQRYSVLIPSSGHPSHPSAFVCARCNGRRSSVLRKCNVPCAVTLNRLAEPAPHRTVTISKPQKKGDSFINYHSEPRKYNCSQCTQRFILARRLAEHVKNVHGDSLDTVCIVCGNDLKTRTKLDTHLKIHTGELHQCETCKLVFKSKHALQTHMIRHKKSQVA